MRKLKLQTSNLKYKSVFLRKRLRPICFLIFLFSAVLILNTVSAQVAPVAKQLPPTPFRIGERLTYNISFEKFKNAAYAETYVVSRGKLGERDAVELQSKIKTNDFVSAAFYLLDEARTTYAAADTGMPLYVRKTSNASVLPKETVSNFTVTPATSFDWLTLLYQVRNAGGVGNFSMLEDEKVYSVSFVSAGNEKLKTDAGEFETSISTAQSQFFVEKGITDFRINFSADEARIPILIRFKTAKGEFRAELASIQMLEPDTSVVSPTPTQTPRPQATPKPAATPAPYVENQPLASDLPFKLGETLEYQISNNGQMLGMITLQAKERKLFMGEDSLLLTAIVTGTQPNQQILRLNDTITAQVNPETLAPRQITLQFSSMFAAYSQVTQFDQKTGAATFNGSNRIEIPVGTHSILSLVYALRSFNLKPSKDPSNPVNDTRVAVFLGTGATVFYLRPASVNIINLKNENVAAQFISVTTGNPQIDNLNLRLWLSTDDKRLPLRFTLGTYQADLITEKIIVPR
ncbi:MAG TPA: DUF3108 domain-containing protein [Pyrinomonadaceae bacterium]|jgi:hypothetical protein